MKMEDTSDNVLHMEKERIVTLFTSIGVYYRKFSSNTIDKGLHRVFSDEDWLVAMRVDNPGTVVYLRWSSVSGYKIQP